MTVWNITVGGQVVASVAADSRGEAAALTDEQIETGQLGYAGGGYHLTADDPVSVPAAVAQAEARAATASEMHDVACAELVAARAAMTAACQRYIQAEKLWDEAGAASADAQSDLGDARKAAGVVLTATGYRNAF